MKIFTHTTIGKRKSQQDSFRLNQENGLYVICDGVGGSEQGSLASQLVSDYIIQHSNEIHNGQTLIDIVKKSSLNLCNHFGQQSIIGSGHTTLALVKIWEESKLSIITIGDSRVYIINPYKNEIWHSKDHTLLQEILDHGLVSHETDLNHHPMRHRLTKSIGSDEILLHGEIEIIQKSIVPDDEYILICSDGVWELIESEVIIAELRTSETNIFVQRLADIVDHYASDNATFIFLDLKK